MLTSSMHLHLCLHLLQLLTVEITSTSERFFIGSIYAHMNSSNWQWIWCILFFHASLQEMILASSKHEPQNVSYHREGFILKNLQYFRTSYKLLPPLNVCTLYWTTLASYPLPLLQFSLNLGGNRKAFLVWYCCKWAQWNRCGQVGDLISLIFLLSILFGNSINCYLLFDNIMSDIRTTCLQVWLHCTWLPCLWYRL